MDLIKVFKTLFAVVIIATSCTDPIDIDLKEGAIQLAVDGMISDQSKIRAIALPDTIRLTTTNAYLSGTVKTVDNAIVIISDNAGLKDTLTYLSNGKYITDIEKITGKEGNTYMLSIYYEGETYQSVDKLNRVTTIDSLVENYRPEPEFGRAPGNFIELFAKDVKGIGDCYRFKVYKNGVLFNRPSDLVLAGDAGFASSGGFAVDSVRFIFPIREALNPASGVNDPDTNGDKAPFIPGDLVTVEILSLSPATFAFYQEMSAQINNDGLFANPAVNVVTNVINTNPASKKKAVGWFQASAVVAKSVRITESK